MSEARRTAKRPSRLELLALSAAGFFTTRDQKTTVRLARVYVIAASALAVGALCFFLLLTLAFISSESDTPPVHASPVMTVQIWPADIALFIALVLGLLIAALLSLLCEQLDACSRFATSRPSHPPAPPPFAAGTEQPTVDELRTYAAAKRDEAMRDLRIVTDAMDSIGKEMFT